MSILSLIMISGMISFAAYGIIALTGRHTREEERRITARNRTLFIKSFPFLWGFTVLTLCLALISLFFIIFKNQSDNLPKIFEKEFAFKDIIIPFFILTGISLPISLKNFQNASNELKNYFPFLIVSILLMVIFNSLTISLLIELIFIK